MAQLIIEDFPDNLYQYLQEKASQKQHSIASELIELIEQQRNNKYYNNSSHILANIKAQRENQPDACLMIDSEQIQQAIHEGRL